MDVKFLKIKAKEKGTKGKIKNIKSGEIEKRD